MSSAHQVILAVIHRFFESNFKKSIVLSYDILTKRYRCVWRKARRINRFRAFSGPDFFFQTIDADRSFSTSDSIRTGRFPFSGRCIQPAPFLNGDFSDWQRYFSQKNSQRIRRRFVASHSLKMGKRKTPARRQMLETRNFCVLFSLIIRNLQKILQFSAKTFYFVLKLHRRTQLMNPR